MQKGSDNNIHANSIIQIAFVENATLKKPVQCSNGGGGRRELKGKKEQSSGSPNLPLCGGLFLREEDTKKYSPQAFDYIGASLAIHSCVRLYNDPLFSSR